MTLATPKARGYSKQQKCILGLLLALPSHALPAQNLLGDSAYVFMSRRRSPFARMSRKCPKQKSGYFGARTRNCFGPGRLDNVLPNLLCMQTAGEPALERAPEPCLLGQHRRRRVRGCGHCVAPPLQTRRQLPFRPSDSSNRCHASSNKKLLELK